MTKVAGDFLPQLQQALLERGEYLEEKRLPGLIEALGTFRSVFESIIGILVQKGLLREDRYEYDGRPTELEPLADLPMAEGAEVDEAGSRISTYRLQLDFLIDSVPLTFEALDIPTVRKIFQLLSFIDWGAFGDSSSSPMTRALARAVSKVRLSTDSVSARALHDSQARITRLLRDIRARLSEIETWKRESWKAEARVKAMPRAVLQLLAGKADRTESMTALQRAFEQAIPEGEWRPDLVQELLAEERPEDGAVKRERLLRALELPPPPPTCEELAAQRRCTLVEALHSLCRVKEEIEFAESVIVLNEADLGKRSLGVVQRLRRWLQKIVGKVNGRFYEIEIQESPTAEAKTVVIDFLRFIVELRETQEVLAELAEENGPERARVLGMTDGQMCEFIDWQLSQLRRLHRRMDSLNEYFQLQAVKLNTGAVRSIRVELLAMENGIARADKVRRECLDQLEESDRPKALEVEVEEI